MMISYDNAQLNSPQVFQEINLLVNQHINDFEFGKCFGLARELNKKIENISDGTLKKKYQTLINRLTGISLNLMSDKEVFNFLQTGLADVLKDFDIPIVERIRYKLADLPIFERDEYRKKMIRHILDNQQQLTSKEIMMDGKIVVDTISNWLRDYNTFINSRKFDALARANYFSTNKNVRQLSEEEKRQLVRLLDLFDYLQLSSLTPEGYEETMILEDKGDTIVFDQGDMYILKKDSGVSKSDSEKSITERTPENIIPAGNQKTPASDSMLENHLDMSEALKKKDQVSDEILTAYHGDEKFAQEVARQESKLTGKFGDNVEKLRDLFYKAVQDKSVVHTVALFRTMASNNQLEAFLQEDQKLFAFLAGVWEKQYGPAFVQEFKTNPRQLKFVRLFMRYILEQRLGMNVSDAARIGVQIGTIFVNSGKKEYNKMAYFDVATKKFKWFE